MFNDPLQGKGAPVSGGLFQPVKAEAPTPDRQALPDSPTEKLRAFLRSGRYQASEVMDVYSGAFKFIPLGDTETADMRHQRELGRHEPKGTPHTDSTPPSRQAPQNDNSPPHVCTDSRCQRPVTPFVTLSPNLCLHRHGRHEGCRRCIDACSSGAIQAGSLTPHHDPDACLGCGLCTGACPSGALQWRHSASRALLQRLRSEMTFWTGQNISPWVVFQDQPFTFDDPPPNDPQIVRIDVWTVGMLGMEIFLSAIALGAVGVVVLTSSERLDRLCRQLQWEIRCTRMVLQAAGFGGASIHLLDVTGAWKPADPETGPPIQPAQYPLDRSKREVVCEAVAHLLRQAVRPFAREHMPPGAPFGAVALDGTKCTLCMACVGSCKMNALQILAGEAPGLQFQEKDCVQCGLCVRVCPEKALTLIPRIDPEAYGVKSLRILHQAAPARCITCGSVFASQKMIETIRGKLQGHWMYAGHAQKRLSMCDRCRVEDFIFNPSSEGE